MSTTSSKSWWQWHTATLTLHVSASELPLCVLSTADTTSMHEFSETSLLNLTVVNNFDRLLGGISDTSSPAHQILPGTRPRHPRWRWRLWVPVHTTHVHRPWRRQSLQRWRLVALSPSETEATGHSSTRPPKSVICWLAFSSAALRCPLYSACLAVMSIFLLTTI